MASSEHEQRRNCLDEGGSWQGNERLFSCTLDKQRKSSAGFHINVRQETGGAGTNQCSTDNSDQKIG